MMRPPLAGRRETRRGVALAVAVLLLSTASIMTVAAVTAGADDGRLAALRVESLRAFYAAESGALLARRRLADAPLEPLSTEIVLMHGQRVVVIAPFKPPPAAPGLATVEGRCGSAARRIDVPSD